MFQSLLSQGISLLGAQYPDRVSGQCATFQSLLSQGISLLFLPLPAFLFRGLLGFNPFLVRASVYCIQQFWSRMVLQQAMFQSLLSQGISLLCGTSCIHPCAPARFQSLLSQGISLLQNLAEICCEKLG